MIVGIAGKIASGKSTLARALAARMNAKRLGFGDYVRAVAQANGLDFTNRKVLQDLGHELVTKDPAAFVNGILASANYITGQRIVFDGIRHTTVWEQITMFASRNNDIATLVYLDMSDEHRRARLSARGLSPELASAFDQHSSERDVDERLRNEANLMLDARLETGTLIDTILRIHGT